MKILKGVNLVSWNINCMPSLMPPRTGDHGSGPGSLQELEEGRAKDGRLHEAGTVLGGKDGEGPGTVWKRPGRPPPLTRMLGPGITCHLRVGGKSTTGS